MREDVLGASSSRGHTPRGRGNLLSAQGRVSGSGWMGVMGPEWGGQWQILWNESYSYMNLPGMCLPFLEGIRDGWDDVSPTESADLSLDLFKDDEFHGVHRGRS